MNKNLLIVEDEFIVANDLAIILENAGYKVCGIADTVESAKEAIEKFHPAWVLLDIFLQDGSMGTELAPFLQERGIGFIYISANTNQSILEIAKSTQPYGFLVKPFREKDLLIMLDIARGRHESNLQFARQRENMLSQQIKSLAEEQLDFESKLLKIPSTFQSLIPFDYMAFHFQSGSTKKAISKSFNRVGFNEYQLFPLADELFQDDPFLINEWTGSPQNNKGLNECGVNIFEELLELFPANQTLQKHELSARLQLSCLTDKGNLRMAFFSKKGGVYDQTHTTLLSKTDKAILDLFNRLSGHPVQLEQPLLRRAARIQTVIKQPKFEGIYGNSAGLLNVLDNIELVAATPVSVLILGESGTGKEKVALNIHKLSPRVNAPFITVNCAAMPADLIESELFGHEKGAFTGAVDKRIGKFEAANGGTIFLDEIGEMPLDSQVKLLRVLQDKQFEPVGGSKTIKVDVRIITATNRNLEKEVAEGRFRLDLFYRLNVYPIEVPPLRERKDDIPILAKHFLARSAANMSRESIPTMSQAVIDKLLAYPWPGNIRELQHLMERTLIKTRQNIIEMIELPNYIPIPKNLGPQGNNKTLEQIETEHILAILRACGGKVSGTGGAAEILGLAPSTLTSRMKKLGIKKELYHDL